MATAYGVYGSGGYHNEPFTYYSVTTGDVGDETVLLEGGKDAVEVLDPQTCYVMIKLMQRVTIYGTAADLGKAWSGWEVYGKTGTSESNRDVYFTGGTPYYAAASWFGYDNNQVMISKQTGYAKNLWNKAMKALHQDLEIKEFTVPEGVQSWKYCTVTGQRATAACPGTDTGYYKSSLIPGYCTAHNGKPLNPDGSLPEPAPTTPTTPPTEDVTTSTSESSTTTATTTTTAAAGETE
jgi:penicillin-binding protein 1A